MSVILPGKTAHPVVAMVSNRTYGLDTEAGRPCNRSRSRWSVTGRLDLQDLHHGGRHGVGHGISANLDVPVRFEAKGLGSGGARAARGHLVRAERGQLPRLDERHRCAGAVAEHRLRQADLAGRGAAHRRHGGQSWAAVLRRARHRPAYDPETNESLADFIKRYNLGSFTLGPIEVNALELSNVAATLASGGCGARPTRSTRSSTGTATRSRSPPRPASRWCRGSGQHPGERDEPRRPPTAPRGVGRFGGLGPADVGQDRHHRGAPVLGFLGFTNTLRGGELHLRRLPNPTDLCSWPLRQCGDGNPTGAASPPDLVRRDETDRRELRRRHHAADRSRATSTAPGSRVPSVSGLSQDSARERIKESGFQVADQANRSTARRPTGRWWARRRAGRPIPGSIITILISNGIPPAPPPPPPAPRRPRTASRRRAGSTVVEIPACRRSPCRCWRLRPAVAVTVRTPLSPGSGRRWQYAALTCPPRLRLENLGPAAVGSAAPAVGYAAVIERNAFVVREVTMPVLTRAPPAAGAAPVSDIHMRPTQKHKQAWLRELARWEPDLVVNTGDNLSHPAPCPRWSRPWVICCRCRACSSSAATTTSGRS